MHTSPPVDLQSNGTITIVDETKDVEIEPTDEELMTIEHIVDRIPLTAWILIFGQFCQEFAFFGTSAIFQNYIQFPLPTIADKQPGALDRGRIVATAMTMSYSCLYNFSPIVAAVIADQFWGKYKTITVACFLYCLGLLILVCTSIPISIQVGIGFPGLICALLILGISIGAFKTTLGPFMAEQYTRKSPAIKDIKGQRKIIDPHITIQSLFNWCYWAANVGALTAEFAAPTVEKYHSYWLAYLLTLIIFPGCMIVLLIGRHRFIRKLPTGSLVIRAFDLTWNAIRNRWKLGKQSSNHHLLDYAKDSMSIKEIKTVHSQNKLQFIDDLKQTIRACRVFLFFPFFWMCYNQEAANLVSQAAQMNAGPVPNDLLQLINPLTVVIFVPIFDKIIYPTLRKCKIKLGPIKRMTCGFAIASLALVWAAIVQYLIYSTPPNFNYTIEPCLNCQKFNNISIAWQVPSYFLMGIGEIFAVITGLEYAYTNAPDTMKSIVMALFFSTRSMGSLLNVSLVPVTVDPNILWIYVSMAIVTFITAIIFYLFFRNDDRKILLKDEQIQKESVLSVTIQS